MRCIPYTAASISAIETTITDILVLPLEGSNRPAGRSIEGTLIESPNSKLIRYNSPTEYLDETGGWVWVRYRDSFGVEQKDILKVIIYSPYTLLLREMQPREQKRLLLI